LRNAGLANISDSNSDGVISAAELLISRDGVALSLPIIAGMPFILVVFAATAGIAATLGAGAAHAYTAGSAISDDLYHGVIHRTATPGRRLVVARLAMILIVIGAAWYATSYDYDILRTAIAALSLTGAAFFPALLLSIWWKGTTKWGVLTAMLTGAGVAAAHMFLQLSGTGFLWPGINGLLAAMLGIPAGLIAGLAVSLATPKPSPEILELADDMRDPSGEALLDRAARLAPLRNRPELPENEQQPPRVPEKLDAAP